MISNDQAFVDWEGSVFGYGYGSGEEHILPSLKSFLEAISENDGYDFRLLESAVGAQACWFLINALCHANIIEYGSSPRFGWLTEAGKRLRGYLKSKSVDQLLELLSGMEVECGSSYCNCHEGGSTINKGCSENPFFRSFGK